MFADPLNVYHESLGFWIICQYYFYSTQLTGRQFFGTELHNPYDVHFLKADGIWNAIVRLKR